MTASMVDVISQMIDDHPLFESSSLWLLKCLFVVTIEYIMRSM